MEAVDLVDEEDVAFGEGGEDAGEVARLFDLRAGGGVDLGADGGGDDVGEGGFAETRGPAEEDVVEDVAAHPGGVDAEGEEFFDLVLAGELVERRRAEGGVERGLRGGVGLGEEVVAHGAAGWCGRGGIG